MNKKNLTWSIVGVVVVLAIIGLVWWYQSSSSKQSVSDNSQTTNTATDTTSGSTTGTVKLAYTKAVNMYVGKRIQFDETCVATPNNPTFKKGTVIMLDNRSSKTRVIALDSVKYTIKADDYVLATLTTTAKLPHTILVDCGNGQNNASIYLQQ